MSKSTSFSLLGMTIVGQHGREIGTISEVLVELESWTVGELEIKLNRETLDDLELKRPMFGTQKVRVPTSEISGASDVLVLKRPLEDMEFSGGRPASNDTGNENASGEKMPFAAGVERKVNAEIAATEKRIDQTKPTEKQ